MNREQLKQKLVASGIEPSAYSLSGGLPNEQYVLSPEEGGRWEVYYSERGQKTSRRQFPTEDSACEYFWELIRKGFSIK